MGAKEWEYWLSTNMYYNRFTKETRHKLIEYIEQYINEDITQEEFERIQDEFKKMELATFKGRVRHFIYDKKIARIRRKIIRVLLFDSSFFYGEPINIRFGKIRQLVENMTDKELIRWKDKWDWDIFLSEVLLICKIIDFCEKLVSKFKSIIQKRR